MHTVPEHTVSSHWRSLGITALLFDDTQMTRPTEENALGDMHITTMIVPILITAQKYGSMLR